MNTWAELLEKEKQQDYFINTLDYVAKRREQGVVVFPPQENVFSAFTTTEFNQVKVVILGQDPYHGPEQAHGLAFSVKPGVKVPPSLVNMCIWFYKEL